MRELRTFRSILSKAILFLVIGLTACGLILAELPELRIFILLALAIWAFCRAYYFAFYVIEKYLDPTFRFSGLFSVLHYLWKRR